MKKTVPFEFFEAGQYLYFDIARLVLLERLLKESLVKISERAATGDISIDFIVKSLTIGLKHHYPHGTEQFFADKLTEYLENGGVWFDLMSSVSEAIVSIWNINKDDEPDTKNAVTVQEPELTV